MKTIMGKEALLKILIENGNKHKGIFLEAIEGYRREAILLLEKQISKLKAGKTIDQYINLPVPIDHTRDYNRVIRMIKLDTRNEITLEEQEFSQYVEDDWKWKREWLTTANSYTASQYE